MGDIINKDYLRSIQEFPCAFNLVGAETLRQNRERLKAIMHNFVEANDSLSSESEKIRNSNLLTWIYFHLRKLDKAVEESNEVVELTNWKNISSLANRVIVMQTRDKQEANKCLELLKKLKDENFRDLLTEAKAEQAYYYSRLGGPGNLKMAISLFSEVVTEKPDNYLWKFGLGLTCRRATHANIFCTSTERMDVEKCKKMAAEYLFDVADNADSRLQAMAYAQLANLQNNHPDHSNQEFEALFRNLSIQELCDKALEKGREIPSVLIHCSRYIRTVDVDLSISLLEESVRMRPKSIAYHYLGQSYIKKVKDSNRNVNSRGNKRGFKTSYSKNRRQQDKRGVYVSKPKIGSLNKDDELVKKAKECFQTAIKIKKVNYPVMLSLGTLLMETGEIHHALIQYNEMINYHLENKDHRLTLISAYEQAGLCYLELSKTDASDKTSEELGKKMLTTAVGLAADLAVLMPELTDSQELWTAFRTLESEIDRESPSPNQQKKKIKLLELARDYGHIVEVVQKLREFSEDELNDPGIVVVTLKSYLNLGQPDNALAFQNIIGLRPGIGEWWTTGPVYDLRIQVLLEAVSERLKNSTGSPTALFQQLFKLSLGTCFGVYESENEDMNPGGDFVGDVLIVYDGDYDSETDPSPTMKSARCLKEVANSLFGLKAEENLQGCYEYGDVLEETQLREMRRYRVLIIMLGNERREGLFEAIIKSYKPTDPSHQRTLIMEADVGEIQVPLCLNKYDRYKLKHIGGLGDVADVPGSEDEDGQLPVIDILNDVSRGDVDAILKLFCAMIGKVWPCP